MSSTLEIRTVSGSGGLGLAINAGGACGRTGITAGGGTADVGRETALCFLPELHDPRAIAADRISNRSLPVKRYLPLASHSCFRRAVKHHRQILRRLSRKVNLKPHTPALTGQSPGR